MLNLDKLEALWIEVVQRAQVPNLNPEIAYLFGQGPKNQTSVVEAAGKFNSKTVIAILGHEGSPGFGGATSLMMDLVHEGISRERIIPIHSAIPQDGTFVSNTLTEAKGLAKHIAPWKGISVAIVAPPWHIVRCYMTIAGQYHLPSTEVRLYPVMGSVLSWNDEASHSQGTTVGARWNLQAMEVMRIIKYYMQGDLPDPELVLAYLKKLE